MEQLKKLFPSDVYRLSVADFNHRAIHLYKKIGFSEVERFQHKNVPFIVMSM
ncbi:GNAT family N-acetyltransferase [Priestia koreensis]|uniref:GNAT family N-acetyltransferase n=1 Tax=Priestia koreensis TaxID=284581 RepID=UPI001F5A87A0|nr:hypothetical protein [Priestia koreensis]UNL83045.1 hypothetical protein IE339_12645 [Priestia koreensis]